MSTKAEFEAELALIKARADYYERLDLIYSRAVLGSELNRLHGATQPGKYSISYFIVPLYYN